MVVFTLETGNIFEGGSVRQIFTSERAARIAFDAEIATADEEWAQTREPKGEWGGYDADNDADDHRAYRSNRESQIYVKIRRFTVEGLPACMVA